MLLRRRPSGRGSRARGRSESEAVTVASEDTSARTEEEPGLGGGGGGAGDELEKLLEQRETLMRFSPIFAAITGARIGVHSSSSSSRHLEVVRVLVEAGANVHAKDVAGYSPLAHCVSGFGDMTATLEMR